MKKSFFLLAFLCFSCESETGYDNSSNINPNDEIIGQWELNNQQYSTLDWNSWESVDTIYTQDFISNEYILNINNDGNQNFDITWTYNNYNWYFFGHWEVLGQSDEYNMTLLDWNFIEYPDTYLDEFYSLPNIVGYQLKRASYPNPDTLCIFWEKSLINNYYGIDYLTKK